MINKFNLKIFTIDSLLIMGPHIKSGALHPIALTSLKRSDLLPGIPTVSESGLTNFQAIGWFGLFAPIKTNPIFINKINAEVSSIMKLAEVKSLLLGQGVEPFYGSPDDLKKHVTKETELWSGLIRELGIKVE